MADNSIDLRRYRRQYRAHRLSGADPRGEVRVGLQHQRPNQARHIPFVSNQYAVLLVLEGRGTYSDAGSGSQPLGPGVLLQRFPGLKHVQSIEGGRPWTAVFAAVPRCVYRTLELCGAALPTESPVLECPLDAWIPETVLALTRDLESASPTMVADVLCRVQRFLVNLRHYLMESGSAEGRLFSEASRLLHESACSRTPLPELAEQMGISYSLFRQVFRRHTGMSPGAYRIARRMEKARALLCRGDLSPGEVAAQLGYRDVYAFSHQFKAQHATTPAAFRKRGRES